jgi:hypothetical protein
MAVALGVRSMEEAAVTTTVQLLTVLPEQITSYRLGYARLLFSWKALWKRRTPWLPCAWNTFNTVDDQRLCSY